MTELENLIRQIVEREGPISVARYMQLALQHPAHGYYMKGDPLGVAGDFTTAPEISQMFGELIGIWCAEIWRQMGSPARFTLLELGPGRGTLMQDALRATAKVDGFQRAMALHLLESNVTLQAAQREKIGSYNPTYLSDLGKIPAHPIIVIANEFFDAMPVHQYVKTDKGWHERMVGLQDGKLVFVVGSETVPLPLPEDKSFYEFSQVGVSMVQEISSRIAEHGGAALIIDYGYTESGGADTLQAVFNHAPIGTLEQAGAVDLSAHVDFTALRLAAEKQGLRVTPTIQQTAFLKAMGIDLRAWQLKMQAGYDEALEIDAGLARLIDMESMGALFKAMAIYHSTISEVPGFP